MHPTLIHSFKTVFLFFLSLSLSLSSHKYRSSFFFSLALSNKSVYVSIFNNNNNDDDEKVEEAIIHASLTVDNRCIFIEYIKENETNISILTVDFMSVYTDRVDNDRSLPMTYSINIQTSSLSKRPLTCYITTSPLKQFNSTQPTSTLSKKCRDNKSRSTIHLPVTYSTSIHLPCQPATVRPSFPPIVPSPISYHHYHHHYYHQRESPAIVKDKFSPHSSSIASTRPATTSSTTITSPDSSLSPVKKQQKSIFPSPPPAPPPLPSYSALVWNWFHHRSTKPTSPLSPPPRKGSQSDYSETCRRESPGKRTLLFKFLPTTLEKHSKSKQQRSCFTRKRFPSSSSLPNKTKHYPE